MITATEELLSPQEAGARLGVSVYTVRRWIKEGKLRAFRPGKEYRVRVADLEEFFRTREVHPKVLTQPETSAQAVEVRPPDEFERALARVLEPARTDVLRDEQAGNRALASQGRPQHRIVDLPEAEVARRFMDEFSPDERPLAFGEVALGHARLQETLARAEKLLRDRGQKIAQLEEEIAQLREEHKRAEARKT